jgi:hypothetical protein
VVLRHILPGAVIAGCFLNPIFLIIGPVAWISYAILGPFVAANSNGTLDQEFVAGLLSGFAFVLLFFLVLI